MVDKEQRFYHLRQAGNRLKSRKGGLVFLFDKRLHFLRDLLWIVTTIRYLDDSIIDRVRHRTSTHYCYSLHLCTKNTFPVFHMARILVLRKRMNEENKQKSLKILLAIEKQGCRHNI